LLEIMASFPSSVPVQDWLSSGKIEPWFTTTVVPWVGPPLLLAVLLPLAISILAACICGCGCGRNKKPNRRWASAVSAAAFLLSLALLAAAVYELAKLVAAASTLASQAAAVTSEAQGWVCAAQACEVGAELSPSPPPASHAACPNASMLGFTEGLGQATREASSAAVDFVSNLSATVDTFQPVLTTTAATLTLTQSLAANLSLLTDEVAALRAALSSAASLASPYFSVNATLWGPLNGSAALVPLMPPAPLEETNALASQLSDQQKTLQATLEDAEAAAASEASTVLPSVSDLNSTVADQVVLLTSFLEQARGQIADACTTVGDVCSASGLPAVQNAEPLPTLQAMGSPLLYAFIGFVVFLALPPLALACATVGGHRASKRGRCLTARSRCCGATLSLLTTSLLLLLAALLLAAATIAAAACHEDNIDRMIETNLASLGNVSVGTASIGLATLITDVLHCGQLGRPRNALELLGLAHELDFEASAADLTSALTTQLQVFNASAIVPLDQGIARLDEMQRVLEDTAAAADPGFGPAAAEGLLSLSQFYLSNLPPSNFNATDQTQLVKYNAFYGLQLVPTPTAPTAAMMSTNAAIRANITAAAGQVPLVLEALDGCNRTAVAAPASLDAVGGSLHAARGACTWVLTRAEVLVSQISEALDRLSAAEAVSSCAWVGAAYDGMHSTICEDAQPALGALGLALAVGAALVGLGLCALLPLRQPEVAPLFDDWFEVDQDEVASMLGGAAAGAEASSYQPFEPDELLALSGIRAGDGATDCSAKPSSATRPFAAQASQGTRGGGEGPSVPLLRD